MQSRRGRYKGNQAATTAYEYSQNSKPVLDPDESDEAYDAGGLCDTKV
jgi:hypothetical protein